MPQIILIDGRSLHSGSLRKLLVSCGYDVTIVPMQDINWSENPCSLYIGCISNLDENIIECIQRIKAKCNTPIIIVGQETNQSDVVATLDAGANDFVSIPYSREVLKARIRVQLRDSK